MKKVFVLFAAFSVLASCGLKEEFQPVFTGKYTAPGPYEFYEDSDFSNLVTVREVAKYYYDYLAAHPEYKDKSNSETAGCGVKVETPMVVKGVISTSDQWGNFYKSFYIQDETGAIEVKVGRNGLYNDYLPGQTVYVNCEGLYLGMYTSAYKGYNGMVSIGDQPDMKDRIGAGSNKGLIRYETANIDLPAKIDMHIFRGNPSEVKPVTPVVLTVAQLPVASSSTQATDPNIGRLVTLKNLYYSKEAFCLLYVDNQADHDIDANRVFLDGSASKDGTKASDITTWAMSAGKMKEHLLAGDWDGYAPKGGKTIASYRHIDDEGEVSYSPFYIGAYSVSQYFKMENTREFQLRTSGYCRFADYEIPKAVLSGDKPIEVTGILSIYQDGFQITVNNLSDIKVDGKPLEYDK